MHTDIAIIGASSSGLYAAELLARAGKRVALFERQDELQPARRTYIITAQMCTLLGWMPGEAVLHTTNVMEVETVGERIRVPLQQPDVIVERGLMSRNMLARVESAGANYFPGYRFQGFVPVGSSAQLLFHDSFGKPLTVRAAALIGADGVFSQVAMATGMPLAPHVPIVQAEVALPLGWDPRVTKVWFNPDETPYFYWMIPESRDRGVVGLVGNGQGNTRMLLQSFLRRHGMNAQAFQGGWVAMHHPRLRPWGKVGTLPVYLVGDAAGQVKVTTVGGTVTGFWGVQAVVRSILNGTAYGEELRPLKRELDLHWFMRLLLERLDNSGYDQLMRYVSPGVQRMLSRHNRDRMAGVFWKFPFREPRLLWLGLKLLFSRPYYPRDFSRGDRWQHVKS